MSSNGKDTDDVLGESEKLSLLDAAATNTGQEYAAQEQENQAAAANAAAPEIVAEVTLASPIKSPREAQEYIALLKDTLFQEYVIKNPDDKIICDKSCLVDTESGTVLIRAQDDPFPPTPPGGVSIKSNHTNTKHQSKLIFEDPTNPKLKKDLIKDVLGGDNMSIKWTVECEDTDSLIAFLKNIIGPTNILHLEPIDFTNQTNKNLDQKTVQAAYNSLVEAAQTAKKRASPVKVTQPKTP